MTSKPPAPKVASQLDKAKQLEDFMHGHNLELYEVRELLAIIEFSKRDIR